MRDRILQHYSNRRLIVKGFHPKHEHQLRNYFLYFGEVSDVFSTPAQSYAFVTFSKLHELPPIFHQFNGRTITAEKLSPYNNPEMKTRVILANGIFNQVSNTSIINYFSKYGEVLSVKKQRNDQISRFAYITFKDIDSAERAVSQAVHLINSEIVDVRKARTPKE